MNKKPVLSLMSSLLCFAMASPAADFRSIPSPAYGDRCSCPPATEDGSSRVVYEPTQRAVVLWNGQEEILYLSTDLSSPYIGPMAEVLALPAEPQVAIGSLDVFAGLVELAGPAHLRRDFLPAAPRGVMSSSLLVGNLNDPLFRPPLANKCHRELEYYRSNGMPWAVVNSVNIDKTNQSFPPIEYRFNSGSAFYPLRISTADLGMTQIDLIVITKSGLSTLPSLEYPIEVQSRFTLSAADLAPLSPAWATFFQPARLAPSTSAASAPPSP